MSENNIIVSKMLEQKIQDTRELIALENSKRSDKQWEYDRNKQKISRLEVVKSVLETYLENAADKFSLFIKYNENTDNFADWSGSKYNKIKDNINAVVLIQYANYVLQIDEARESVNGEIKRLEKQNEKLQGVILYIDKLLEYIEIYGN